MSATFVCGCGCGTPVFGIYCEKARAAREAERRRVSEERSARMSSPEYQAMLQAARAAKALPATEGK